MKTEVTKKLKEYKFKFVTMILIVDLIAIIIVYFMMPLIQNFPPLSGSLIFPKEMQSLTYIQQSSIAYIIGVTIHLVLFRLLMRRIYQYLEQYDKKEKIPYSEIKLVRKDCINLPYKVFFIQMVIITLLGIVFNFIIQASAFSILRFTFTMVAVGFIFSIILLIGFQKLLYPVILTTYEISKQYEKQNGYRISNSQNILLQMVPFIGIILIAISFIGYAKAIQQKGFAIGNYYKAYMESKNISPSEVNRQKLQQILDTIPIQNDSHYYFIISPHDKEIYLSSAEGDISDFVLKYKDYFYQKTNGFLYEKFGADEQLYAMNLKDMKGETWYIGYKYPVIDRDLLIYYVIIVILFLTIYSILLYIWSRNISNNLIKTTNSLKNIVATKNIDKKTILPIVSNDEFGDLSYYYNKMQELTIKNIQKIHNNQETLMERERLASLGQLIGGIAHNLKTPIMSISGATEGLTDLIKEYEDSIDDPEVNSKDHHEIAKEMSSWITKIKTHTEYMSDIITAVKGQAVKFSEEEEISFTIEELLKTVNILMKHELKSAMVSLNTIVKTDENTVINGDVNSLVQVINNMISNAIEAYEGKTEQKIDLIVKKEENHLMISIQDYATGIPKKVKNKLFKQMITTKGKNGTGLGLYMSYSTIRAHFNGKITVETKEGEGTTFHIILPITNQN